MTKQELLYQHVLRYYVCRWGKPRSIEIIDSFKARVYFAEGKSQTFLWDGRKWSSWTRRSQERVLSDLRLVQKLLGG